VTGTCFWSGSFTESDPEKLMARACIVPGYSNALPESMTGSPCSMADQRARWHFTGGLLD
jgi:hypothetical protein